MKNLKSIFLIAFIMMFSLSYGQEEDLSGRVVYEDGKAAVKEVYGDAKSMAPKVEAAVEKLATSLKTTADKLWDILVRQQTVNSIVILMVLILTVLSWLHFWYRWNLGNKMNWGGRPSAQYEIACAITLALALAGTVVTGIHFNDMVTGFVNPEYGALKTIAQVAQQIQ